MSQSSFHQSDCPLYHIAQLSIYRKTEVSNTSAQPKVLAELIKFLSDFAKISNRIHLEERDMADLLRSPVSFMLEVDGKANGHDVMPTLILFK